MRPAAWRGALRFAMIAAPRRRATLNELGRPSTTLAWGRTFLPAHFAKPASTMHEWLGERLDTLQIERGTKINLIGPRGSAKSTIATLCYVLRAGPRRLGAVHLDYLGYERASSHSSREYQSRAYRQCAPEKKLSRINGAGQALAQRIDSTEQSRHHRFLRHRPKYSWTPQVGRPPVAHRLRRLAERLAHVLARAARSIQAMVPRHALKRRHEAYEHHQPGHRPPSRSAARSNCIARPVGPRETLPRSNHGPRKWHCGAIGNPSTAMQRIPKQNAPLASFTIAIVHR